MSDNGWHVKIPTERTLPEAFRCLTPQPIHHGSCQCCERSMRDVVPVLLGDIEYDLCSDCRAPFACV